MGYLSFDYSEEQFGELESQIVRAFDGGEQCVRLQLDGLEHLGSDTVRGLITLLRRSREHGGDITLAVSKPELRRSLGVLALDRLFTIDTGVAA